ncbi:hypothetical protein [Streptomyces sp. CA2R106]|uniref:hypothetical protein n=1 Tax=Streptomyces sp. CA2R106 TaxID=3120153 RepID=UPI00300A604B
MTAPAEDEGENRPEAASDEGEDRPERWDRQWAEYGVNVGHAVYGGIHIHPPIAPGPSSRPVGGMPYLGRVARHRKFLTTLADFAQVCRRAVRAMSDLRLDDAGKEQR